MLMPGVNGVPVSAVPSCHYDEGLFTFLSCVCSSVSLSCRLVILLLSCLLVVQSLLILLSCVFLAPSCYFILSLSVCHAIFLSCLFIMCLCVSGGLRRSSVLLHWQQIRAGRSGQLGGRLWSSQKTRSLHQNPAAHSVDL